LRDADQADSGGRPGHALLPEVPRIEGQFYGFRDKDILMATRIENGEVLVDVQVIESKTI
jgi:hypothetical protein